MFEGETIRAADLASYPAGTVFSFLRKVGQPSALMIKGATDRGAIRYRALASVRVSGASSAGNQPNTDWSAFVGHEQPMQCIFPSQPVTHWVVVYSTEELLTLLDDIMLGLRSTRNLP